MRRLLRLFMLFGLLGMVSVVGLVLIYFATTRNPAVPDGAVLILRPGGELLETRPDDVFAQVLGSEGVTVRGMVESLRKAKRDDRVTAVLLRPSALATPFWGKVQELRDAIVDFRQSGKEVIAYLEYGGDREYYLASSASQVFLMPSSSLDLAGLASYEVFLRGTLDRVGAEPDFLQIGAYKTAPNQLTQSAMTPAHREMSESLNRDLYEQLVRGIAQARRKTPGEVRTLLDEGPFTADAALRADLVDGLAYLDQLDDRVTALRGENAETAFFEERDYQRVSADSVGIEAGARMAILTLSGLIVSGKSVYDPVNGALVGSDTVVEQLRQIRDDESIRAIILRIDSPGGSSVASDVIWRELMITREARPSVPIVASMADLAASGGYYVAAPAHAIVAQPGTLTGSIGIYGGKVAIGGTLQKIGVATETIRSGRNADYGSPFEPFTPEQRTKLMAHMEHFYAGFVQKVATSRGSTPERIDAVAQGRVWTGQQAQQHGLVDALGGLQTAVTLAKQRAGIPADQDVELVGFPPRRTMLEALSDRMEGARAGLWLQLAGAGELRALGVLTAPARLFQRGEPLALVPFTFVR